MYTKKFNSKGPTNDWLFILKRYKQSFVQIGLSLLLGVMLTLGGLTVDRAQAQNCDASFYGAQVGHSNEARFIDSSNRNGLHKWYYGDGQRDTGQNLNFPRHQYGSYGQYKVCHVVEDGNCRDSTCQQVTVGCDSLANFNYSVSNLTVNFNSPARNADSIVWNFGDGSIGFGLNPKHTYDSPGSYKVRVNVIRSYNPFCRASGGKTITINTSNPCNVNADFSVKGKGYSRKFLPKSNALTYSWDFGDGDTAMGSVAQHRYGKKDTYNVRLIAKDGPNCADTHTQQVIIGHDNTLKGSVNLQQGKFSRGDSLMVDLYHYDSCKGVYNEIRSNVALTGTDTALYAFYNLPAGKYHVKADPSADSSLNSNYVATYHQKASDWGNADSIVLKGLGNSVTGNRITMLKSANSNGSGNITGYVGGTKASCGNKRRPAEDPLANIPVLLMNKDREAIARTTTDQKGNYEFNDIALSTYYVKVDLPGYDAVAKQVVLNSENSDKASDFKVNEDQITPDETTGISEIKNAADVKLYPTPARSQVNVDVAGVKADQLKLSVTNMRGQLVEHQRISGNSSKQVVQLSVSDWQPGAYILQLLDEHGQIKAAQKLMIK